MRSLLLSAVTMIIATLLKGQEPWVIIDTANKKTLDVNKSSTTLLKQGRFSHSTSKGDIYILPYDNMPCLVPDTRQIAPMPGSIQRVPDSRMPNATPRQQIIPHRKDEKKD